MILRRNGNLRTERNIVNKFVEARKKMQEPLSVEYLTVETGTVKCHSTEVRPAVYINDCEFLFSEILKKGSAKIGNEDFTIKIAMDGGKNLF